MKRFFDLAVSLLTLLIFSPVILIVALLVRIKLGSPVLFSQERPGLHGKPFMMFKFRTMKNLNGPDGLPLPDDQRLTRFGKLLRSTSLDELPELINVIRGEMSLVGPRPLLMEYLTRYSPRQARRHEVRPGITGLAQVNGRNAISWEERFELDVLYVESQSLLLDLKILWQTVGKVLRRDGVSAAGHVTMSKFEGIKNQKENL